MTELPIAQPGGIVIIRSYVPAPHPRGLMGKPISDLYDTDFVTWSQRQSELSRRRASGELVNEADIDWPNVAEEIEAFRKNEARALVSKLATVIEPLLKREASPAIDPRAGCAPRSGGSGPTIHCLLKDAPSLLQTVTAVLAEELGATRREAAASLTDNGETPRIAIGAVVYSEGHVLGDWLP